MGKYDIDTILQGYDENETLESEARKTVTMAEKLVTAGISGSDEAGVRKMLEKRIENNDAARLKAAEDIESERRTVYNGKQMTYGEFQKFLMESFTNALTVRNAQKVIMISTQENIRKGLSPEIGSALVKTAAKGQTSTVAIPTALLRHVQQEIGGIGVRVTQNDIITGFLYWYFGKPDDVYFPSKDAAAKAMAISEALDKNASPARYGELSYNASSAALDRLDALEDKLDMVRSLVAGLTKDSLDSRVKIDKAYIALCFNILNMLAFTPPIMPGQQPQDVDILAGGLAWDLMSGIDDAYDYYKATNGREIYKAKFRKKMGTFQYSPEQTAQPAGSGQDDGGDGGRDYDPYMGDDYDGYDGISMSRFDDDDDDETEGYTARSGQAVVDMIMKAAAKSGNGNGS